MKIFKKSLALLVAVLMLLTSMSLTSFAEETATEGTSDKYTSVTKWMYPYWDGSTKDSNNNPLITSKTLLTLFNASFLSSAGILTIFIIIS